MAKKITIKIVKEDLPKSRRPQAPTCRPHKNKARYDRKKGKKIDGLSLPPRSATWPAG